MNASVYINCIEALGIGDLTEYFPHISDHNYRHVYLRQEALND